MQNKIHFFKGSPANSRGLAAPRIRLVSGFLRLIIRMQRLGGRMKM